MVEKMYCPDCKNIEYPYGGFCPVCNTPMTKMDKNNQCNICKKWVDNNMELSLHKEDYHT